VPIEKERGQPFTVGLTGGIGSGKSTVAELFGSLGVPLLDLDGVGHQVTAGDKEVQAKLRRLFGDGICSSDGAIDRKRLAGQAFASEVATAKLNAIMHPAIWAREERWLSGQTAPYVLIEASVLIESGAAERMDAIIVVLADRGVRRKRVLSRPNAISDEMFDAIVDRQCDDETRLKVADYVIDNNGSLAELRAKVERLHAGLSENSGVDTHGEAG